jgi:rhodanese-related sulfurtransferase
MKREAPIFIAAGIFAGAVLGWAVVRSTNPSKPTPVASSAPVAEFKQSPEVAAIPRVSLAEFKSLYDRNEVIVMDVRDADSYRTAHIAGAIHIPVDYLEGELSYLPRNKTIITYCTCPAEESSGRASLILNKNGFTSRALQGGFVPWRDGGMAVAVGEKP